MNGLPKRSATVVLKRCVCGLEWIDDKGYCPDKHLHQFTSTTYVSLNDAVEVIHNHYRKNTICRDFVKAASVLKDFYGPAINPASLTEGGECA